MTVININTVTELYKAVNDINNAGKKIVLAAGSYQLNPNDPNVGPNAGRLELQEDMELEGQPGHPELVIIDESQLPIGSFDVPPFFKTGGIRVGKGSNAIRWLSVIGKPDLNALSAIDTDLLSAKAIINISNIIVSGSQLAIDIRNPGFAGAGREVIANISHCELLKNTVGGGQGISVQNANGATGSKIVANLQGNYIHHNSVGCRSWNFGGRSTTNNASIKINSKADRIEDNGIGMILNAGTSNNAASKADGNFLSFDAHGSSIKNNDRIIIPFDKNLPPGQIYAVGGYSSQAPNNTSNNKLDINLWGTPVSGIPTPDISAFGARTILGGIAGINNVVTIHLHGVSKAATDVPVPSVQPEPAGTNIVNVLR